MCNGCATIRTVLLEPLDVALKTRAAGLQIARRGADVRVPQPRCDDIIRPARLAQPRRGLPSQVVEAFRLEGPLSLTAMSSGGTFGSSVMLPFSRHFPPVLHEHGWPDPLPTVGSQFVFQYLKSCPKRKDIREPLDGLARGTVDGQQIFVGRVVVSLPPSRRSSTAPRRERFNR